MLCMYGNTSGTATHTLTSATTVIRELIGLYLPERPDTPSHASTHRCKATLTPELFDKFVSALSQYREQRLAIGELVDVVGQCFNHLEVTHE